MKERWLCNCILISFVIIISVPKEELWNHLQGHEGQEAVVLEGAVALIDAVVLGEAAVPAGGEFLLLYLYFQIDCDSDFDFSLLD